MAALQTLLGAAALALVSPALGLGAWRGSPSPGGNVTGTRRIKSQTAAGADRPEPRWYFDAWSVERAGRSPEDMMDDDFDTWYFEHAGRGEADAGEASPRPGEIPRREIAQAPDKHQADADQNWAVDQASKECKTQVGLENGVITYLVTRKSDLFQLKQSVPRLSLHFLKRWAYDVKVFIPGDALRNHDRYSFSHSPTLEEVRAAMRKMLGEDYNWEVVPFNFEFPKVIMNDPDWQSKRNVCAKAVSSSYCHMNQFFTKAMYELPALDKYRYYLRIDADFYFLEDLADDPFCMMAKSPDGRKFMWQTRKEIANGLCSDGLWEWFEQYQQTHGLSPQDPIFWREIGATVDYVGYVGMGDLDFFRSKRVRKLAKAFNEDGRIYLNRWSDQTYYVLLFALFENHTAVGDIGFGWPSSAWCHKCDPSLG